MVHDFWRFTGHISDKELIAAVNTTQSLAKPNEIVALDVDNATVYSYLTNQGGKVPRLNNLLRPFLIWLTMHRIELRVRLVPSRQMLGPVFFSKPEAVASEGQDPPPPPPGEAARPNLQVVAYQLCVFLY